MAEWWTKTSGVPSSGRRSARPGRCGSGFAMSWARGMRTGISPPCIRCGRGAPGISPAQLAMVTVLQFCENLADRQAADEARGRVDWKYCLSLELADEGVEFTTLNGVPGPAMSPRT